MPIANCFVRSDIGPIDADRVVETWSAVSGVADEEMTVNVVHGEQGGKRYAATASLTLPTLWSGDDVERLATGLSHALADATGAAADSILVITTLIPSGSVVEAGHPVHW
ncbi:MAG: hypothetical protein RIB65_18285 [Ilumatobacter fluminis]|uniref:hypothetical protein n=1 Tax=Ilumatobacter fluminis TaxID=467091 RepID=UPI0032EE08E0